MPQTSTWRPEPRCLGREDNAIPYQRGGVLDPASMDGRIQGLRGGRKERGLTLSMVAMNSKAAEVMWKMMMKARSTNMFTGRGGAGALA